MHFGFLYRFFGDVGLRDEMNMKACKCEAAVRVLTTCVAVCCGVLQGVAVCWGRCKSLVNMCCTYTCVLPCVAACSNLLRCVAVRRSVLYCVAVCCSAWRQLRRPCQHVSHTHVCCGMLLCVAVCCSVLQCVAVCYGVLQCVAVCYCIHTARLQGAAYVCSLCVCVI